MREPQEQKKQRLQAVMEELREKYPAKPPEEEITLINRELDLSKAYQKIKSGENNSDSAIKKKKPELNQDSQDSRVLEELLDLPPLKDAGTGLWDSPPYAMNGKICSRKEQDNSIEM